MSSEEQFVYIVDIDEELRRSLARLFKSAGLRCIAFASAAEFFLCLSDLRPGCLILDVQIPGMDGLELQRRLADSGRVLPVIFLTGAGDVESSVQAMKAGAIDFLTKPAPDHVLLDAVNNALRSERRARARLRARQKACDLIGRLTPREAEVMHRMVRGLLNKQIAADLGIVEKTIKVHRARVLDKLEVRSVAEVVRLVGRAGMLEEDLDGAEL